MNVYHEQGQQLLSFEDTVITILKSTSGKTKVWRVCISNLQPELPMRMTCETPDIRGRLGPIPRTDLILLRWGSGIKFKNQGGSIMQPKLTTHLYTRPRLQADQDRN